MFGSPEPIDTESEPEPAARAAAPAPQFLPPVPVMKKPDGAGAPLDEWIRVTQRIYLRYLVDAIPRLDACRDSFNQNARGVLFKLNGLGGAW